MLAKKPGGGKKIRTNKNVMLLAVRKIGKKAAEAADYAELVKQFQDGAKARSSRYEALLKALVDEFFRCVGQAIHVSGAANTSVHSFHFFFADLKEAKEKEWLSALMRWGSAVLDKVDAYPAGEKKNGQGIYKKLHDSKPSELFLATLICFDSPS